ncbi:MAG TPA: 30S ribosomal protein S7 [Patescibacteria group bacterium]|nr:30S ribosomal protein S7 [Patescibacteria group bacterium]
MARRGSSKPKKINPDPVYKNRLVAKFINRVMHDGKKSVTQKQVYDAFELLKKDGDDPIKVFTQAVENIKPNMEVRARRIGGAAYQIPIPVRGSRKESLAIRWLVGSTRARSNSEFKTFAEKLAVELKDAIKGEGLAMKKKNDMERMAEANKAFSHFKW